MSVIPFRLARVSVLAAFVMAALFAPSAVLADDDHGQKNGHGKAHHDDGDRGKGNDKDKNKNKGRDDDSDHDQGHDNDKDKGDGPDKDKGHGNDKDKGKGKDDDDKPGNGPQLCVGKDNMRPSHHANGSTQCPEDEQQQEQPAPTTGVTASAPSLSPAPAALPACTSKRYFKITLGKRRAVRRARVLLNGRLVSVSYGKRNVTARIDLRHRVKGTYIVRTVVVSKKFRIKTGTRRYRVCGG